MPLVKSKLLRINRIESCHDPRNPNSGAVMQKAGLFYEGTARQADKNNQEGFCDACYYAILSEDWRAAI
ncbi:MAG: GNAT family N-acetyltransferase [Ruminococcus sp.]|jgi:ribosomal-protein-alanine N-acetyltransferase|nr:GNAT family N-acetyltransferase [Ruminococcus sp.]